MKKSINNKGILIALGLFMLVFIADIISSYMNADLIDILEVNPIYQLFHSLIPIIIINLIIICLLYWLYQNKKTSVFIRYTIINIIISLIPIRILAVINNFSYVSNPVTIAQAQTIATTANKTATILWLANNFIWPFLVAGIVFILWGLDHEKSRRK